MVAFFHFLWKLRRLRDSRALVSLSKAALIFRIIFNGLHQNRWALLIGAFVRVFTETFVPTLGAFDKYYLIFSRARVVLAILTSVFQLIECMPVTLRTLYSGLIIAFETAILFSIILSRPTFRTLVHFPLFFRVHHLLLLSRLIIILV